MRSFNALAGYPQSIATSLIKACARLCARPLTFAEAVLAHQYAFGSLGIDPSGRPRLKLSRARQHGGLGQPMCKDFRCELQEKALAELLHGRKPFGRLSKRSPADGKANVLKLVGSKRSRLKPRKAIQAGNLAQPMNGD